ncbi:MAG: DUF3604 domain-containing protein, partial [Deltaproteobacteria bacterium]
LLLSCRVAAVSLLVGCAAGSDGADSGAAGAVDPEGLVLAWGDLHAHSAWSFDGCEHPDARCTHDADGPAAGFYDAAAAAGLDFAALTDHAEATTYAWGPDELHAEGGEADVWSGQQAMVRAAEGGPVLPVLGYEWTANADDSTGDGPGTHRTVLLGGLSACDAWRVAGQRFPGGEHRPERGDRVYLQDDVVVEGLLSALHARLDAAEAAEGCQAMRWLTFAHHPAYTVPQATDWSEPDNAPVGEAVVEIYSEHGSSECLDPAAEGCDWQVNDAQGYLSAGAVQAALDEGYRLGFVAGTDAHDARPGSVADGPSHVAHWREGVAAPERQFGGGGLTGVLLAAPLSRDALFDAIEARRTIATSGPRPALVAWAEDAAGGRYPVGAVIPRDRMPATLVLELGPLDAAGTLRDDEVGEVWIERIGEGGRLEEAEPGSRFSTTWDPGRRETWTYLRVRWLRAGGEGLDEERLWLSPWFTTSAGCSSAGAGGGIVGLPLWLLVATRRRRRR